MTYRLDSGFALADCAHYTDRIPSLMVFGGVGGGVGLHDPRFLPPETAVPAMAEAVLAGYVAAATRV